jgi:AmmeMemoRadiSam system protein B
VIDDRPHAPEHSLEVHLPFLQRALDDFTLLPLVVGRVEPRTVADVLDAVWGGPETLIVVSTDLSHYLDHATARRRDRATADAVLAGRIDLITPTDACGAMPLRGFLVAAAEHDLEGRLLDLRTSGDTAGDRQRVVGYAAFSFGRSSTP